MSTPQHQSDAAILEAQIAALTELLVVQEQVVTDQSARLQKAQDELTRRFQEVEAAREAAQRENAKLSAMIGDMKEGIVFADADNSIVEVNAHFCHMVGRSREQIVGKSLEVFHHGSVWDQLRARIHRFRAQPTSPPFELQRSLGPAEVILRMQCICRDGQYDGILLNIIDVTELVKARREAEAANHAKSAFLANMSHEIRTPMTAILGYTDLLTDPALQISERFNYLNVVRRNGEHLLTLINDILDISKIEAGKLEIELRPHRLLNIISDVTSIMRVRAQQRGIDLSVVFPTPVPEQIVTDDIRLRQAIVNLVGNAIKFTEQGNVTLLISHHDTSNGPAIRIAIRDTGIGIDPRQIDRLFRPFSQADSSTSRRFGGTGLGLVISQYMIHMLGGDITVASEVGIGSTFTITIPTGNAPHVAMLDQPMEVFEAVNTEIQSPAHQPRLLLADLNILLAEDGRDNQLLISTVLRKAGAEVTIAENGRIAHDTILQAGPRDFDIILMDVQMPEMDGLQATRLLRKNGCEIPILALTAHAMASDRAKSIEAGCDDHVTKPINIPMLTQKIVQYVKNRTGGAALNTHTQNPPQPHDTPSVIHSAFADDPDMAEIMSQFISFLPEQINSMRTALQAAELPRLAVLAHQLKGAGGGYGYQCLTDVARELEISAKAQDTEQCHMILKRLEDMVQAVKRGFHQPASK